MPETSIPQIVRSQITCRNDRDKERAATDPVYLERRRATKRESQRRYMARKNGAV
jgi:hypothetical protein